MKKVIRLFVFLIDLPLWLPTLLLALLFSSLSKIVILVGAFLMVLSNMFTDAFETNMKYIQKSAEMLIKQVVK